MHDEFLEHVKSQGIKGEEWYRQIPETIKLYEKKWSFKVLQPFPHLTWNYVAPAVQSNKKPVVLKIGFPWGKEILWEIEALKLFNGEGVCRLLAEDREQFIFLTERVLPGVPVSSLEDDEEATRIMARVMKQLWKPLPQNHSFPTVADLVQVFPRMKQKFGGIIPHLSKKLVAKAEEFFKELIETSQESVLTHGDLHQDNVLSSNRDEWLAIDPKGVAAEPAYETAELIRNPYKKMRNNTDIKSIILKRISILSEELEIEPQRIYKWAFAKTMLSAVWSVEDEEKRWYHAHWVAGVLDKMKRKLIDMF